MKFSMRALCIVICMLGTMHIEAIVTHIANQDAFAQELKVYKRLVALVLDTSQIKGDATQILNALHRMLNILSNDHAYRLSRIGFATVDFGNLAQDTRTQLLTALGGKLAAPVTVVLFDNGSLAMADKMPITEADVLEKEENIAHEITEAIEHIWSNEIDKALEKCDHADCSRRLSEEQKGIAATDYKSVEQKARKVVQASPKQVSGARVYTATSPKRTYRYYVAPSYDYGYYGQPAYVYPSYYYDEDYSPWYEYPYYGGYSYGYPFFGVGFGRGSRRSSCARRHGCRF